MNENQELLKEIIFYLSACLDISIKAADSKDTDTRESKANLKVLHDILITLRHLEKINTDKSIQYSANNDTSKN